MNREKLKTYLLTQLGGRENSNGFISLSCSCGRNKQCSAHPAYNYFRCWSAKCPLGKGDGQYKGTILNYLTRVSNISPSAVRQRIEKQRPSKVILPHKQAGVSLTNTQRVELPEGWKPVDASGVIGVRVRRYLVGRSFDPARMAEQGFGYVADPESKYFGRLIIPFYRFGLLVYWIARDFLGKEPKYLNPSAEDVAVGKSEILYNEDALDLQQKIYLVEGWACAETVGEQGVAYLGSELSSVQLDKIRRSPVGEVVIVPDKGAHRLGINIAFQLEATKKVKVLPMDSVYQENQNDVNSAGWQPVAEVEKQTNFQTFSDLINAT